MVGYVDNEKFNILSSLVCEFNHVSWQHYEEAMERESYSYRTHEEKIKRIRENNELYNYYINFLVYRKWRNVYCEKIYNYFYVDASEFANKLANYLTSEKKEKHLVSTYVRKVNSNEVSFLLVHPENVTDFTSFEEDKSIHLINAWLTNYDASNKVNLVNPFVSVEVNGSKLFASTKVFAYLRCLGSSAYYDCKEFTEGKYFKDRYDVWANYDEKDIVVKFTSKVVTDIANSLNIDLNTFPVFERISKFFHNIISGYKDDYSMEIYRVFIRDARPIEELADIEITYYLKNKHLFE